jgi:hypothetical protein
MKSLTKILGLDIMVGALHYMGETRQYVGMIMSAEARALLEHIAKHDWIEEPINGVNFRLTLDTGNATFMELHIQKQVGSSILTYTIELPNRVSENKDARFIVSQDMFEMFVSAMFDTGSAFDTDLAPTTPK